MTPPIKPVLYFNNRDNQFGADLGVSIVNKLSKGDFNINNIETSEEIDILIDASNRASLNWLEPAELEIAQMRAVAFIRTFNFGRRGADIIGIYTGDEMFHNFFGFAIVQANSFRDMWGTADIKPVTEGYITNFDQLTMCEAVLWKYACYLLSDIVDKESFSDPKTVEKLSKLFTAFANVYRYKAQASVELEFFDNDVKKNLQQKQMMFERMVKTK